MGNIWSGKCISMICFNLCKNHRAITAVLTTWQLAKQWSDRKYMMVKYDISRWIPTSTEKSLYTIYWKIGISCVHLSLLLLERLKRERSLGSFDQIFQYLIFFLQRTKVNFSIFGILHKIIQESSIVTIIIIYCQLTTHTWHSY